jgi:hypothetical protein
MRVCVVDGQGGGIGSAVIKRIKEVFAEEVEVWALGTNAIATAQMMKAHANRGATGENAILTCVPGADVVVGPIGICLANAMMGEVTPRMAAAVAESSALKLLLPFTQEKVEVVGLQFEPLPHQIEKIIAKIKELKK